MKNCLGKNVPRNSCGIFAAALLLVVAGATTTWADYHVLAGTQCSAYNNNQANALERSHVRLLNPATNTQSLWVICALDKNATEVQSSTGLIGAVLAYFGPGVTANIDCVWREFAYPTIHVPGGTPDAGNTINADAFTITAPVTTPGVAYSNYSPTAFSISSDNYYTIACKLPPGTGINSVEHNLY
jgi:hypothetical protein